MAEQPVKWYTDGMPGLPELVSNQPGSTIAVLKAILVEGFNEQEPDTLTYDAESGQGVLLFSGGSHGFQLHQIIEIQGADQPEYNGQWRVSPDSPLTEVRFDMGAAPASNGTGTITVKTPPAGWTVPFESEDSLRAVFKPDNANAGDSGAFFYVDNRAQADTGEWNENGTSTDIYMEVRMRGRFGVTDIDTFDDEFGHGVFHNGYNNGGPNAANPGDGGAYNYLAIADDKTCYFSHRSYFEGVNTIHSIVAFGDLVSFRRPTYRDAFIQLNDYATGFGYSAFFGYQRPYINSGAHNFFKRISEGRNYNDKNAPMGVYSFNDTDDYYVDFPLLDGTLPVGSKLPALAGSAANNNRILVGFCPGLRESLAKQPLPDMTFVLIEGRLHLLLHHEYESANVSSESTFFDVEGPWQ